ncbi:hypothetical protein PV04_09802 [Phialophora macrospora]|uniref:Uncharacterized protein n=1 Tax=Phialophora macrospora TaxID=1851006 RepID=A0A0D2FSA9_9EURO|nr:hypothetical protein PV04_09802 [Phialophora macrospora]
MSNSGAGSRPSDPSYKTLQTAVARPVDGLDDEASGQAVAATGRGLGEDQEGGDESKPDTVQRAEMEPHEPRARGDRDVVSRVDDAPSWRIGEGRHVNGRVVLDKQHGVARDI